MRLANSTAVVSPAFAITFIAFAKDALMSYTPAANSTRTSANTKDATQNWLTVSGIFSHRSPSSAYTYLVTNHCLLLRFKMALPPATTTLLWPLWPTPTPQVAVAMASTAILWQLLLPDWAQSARWMIFNQVQWVYRRRTCRG